VQGKLPGGLPDLAWLVGPDTLFLYQYGGIYRRGAAAQADSSGDGVTAEIVQGTRGGIKRGWGVGKDCNMWGRSKGVATDRRY